MYFVIAGNKEQFTTWVREWGYSGEMRRKKADFTYVRNANQLRGLNGGHKVVLVGTYWESPAYKSSELEVALQISRARPLIFGDEDFYSRSKRLEANQELLVGLARLCLPFVMRFFAGKGSPVYTLIERVRQTLCDRGYETLSSQSGPVLRYEVHQDLGNNQVVSWSFQDVTSP